MAHSDSLRSMRDAVDTGKGSGGSAVTGTGADVSRAAERGAQSRPMHWVARFGLACRGVIYLLLGLLAVLVARGDQAEVDQKGVLRAVVGKPFGGVVVALLGVGFACYALWRLSEAIFGVTGEPPGAGPRLRSAARAVVYGFLSVTAFALLAGSTTSQSSQQQTLSAQVMAHPGGRWLVGIVGAAIVLVGLVLAYEGLRLRFMKYFPADRTPEGTRGLIRQLGRIGTIARGLVFAFAGALVVQAAWTYDPQKAGGLDAAVKTLRDAPYGPYVLALAGVGLALFGLYGLAEAAFRRV
jgi:hypothetical protein